MNFPMTSCAVNDETCVLKEIATDHYLMRVRQVGYDCEISFHFDDAWIKQLAVNGGIVSGRHARCQKVLYSVRGDA